jgi:hypothetical protein
MLKRWDFWVLMLTIALCSVITLVEVGFSQEPGPTPAPPEAPKAQTLPVERYLPQKSLLFVTVRRASLLGEYWRSGFLYKLWQEPEIQKAFAQVKKKFDESYQEAEQGFKGVTGATFAEFLSVFQGEVAFSLAGLDTQGLMRGPEAIDFVLSIDAGDKKDALIKIIEKAQETIIAMQGGREGAPVSACYQYKGLTIYSFGTEEVSVNATFLGSRYFLTMKKSTLEGIVDRYYSAEPKDSLETNPVFKKVREKCCTGSEVFFAFADLRGFVDAIEAVVPPEQSKVFSALGISELQGVGFASNMDKSGLVRDIWYNYVPGERKGFYSAPVAGAGVDRGIYFPEESAILYCTGNWNAGVSWSSIMEMVSAFPEEEQKKFLEGLKKVEDTIGFSIEKDFLPGVGTRFSCYIGLPEGGGALPEAAAILEVKDKEKLTKCVDSLVAKLGEKVKKTEFEGNTIYYAALSDLIEPVKEVEFPIPYSPAFAVTDKYLVIGTMPQTVRRTIANLSKPISPSGALKEALARVPNEASDFFYLDLAKATGYLYNTFMPFLKDLPLPEETFPKIDLGALPEAKTITKHLGILSGYQLIDKEGIHSELISSSGPGIISLYSAIIPAITIPSLLKTQGAAWQTAAAGTLRTTATTVETFRVKFGDYPPSEISRRDATGNDRLLFGAPDDLPGVEGNQDCRFIDPAVAKTYTFKYSRVSAEKWSCTADTNRKDLQDLYIDQSGVLRSARSTGDGCQANENSAPYAW